MDAPTLDAAAAHRDDDIVRWLTSGTRDERFIDNIFAELCIRLQHAVELFELRGGGVMGDLAGMPSSQLAVLPGTSHFVPPGSGLLDRADWLLAMIPPFLDA